MVGGGEVAHRHACVAAALEDGGDRVGLLGGDLLVGVALKHQRGLLDAAERGGGLGFHEEAHPRVRGGKGIEALRDGATNGIALRFGELCGGLDGVLVLEFKDATTVVRGAGQQGDGAHGGILGRDQGRNQAAFAVAGEGDARAVDVAARA